MKIIKAPHYVKGGIHPAYHKHLSAGVAIRDMPAAKLLRVSMSQHLGAPATPCVKKGDEVARGQLIGEQTGFISAPVHAPAAGTVTAVVEALTPTGRSVPAVEIETTDEERWADSCTPLPNWQQADAKTLTAHIGAMGVVGMGGAGFPTRVKLSPPPDKPIDALILNGAECEPYLTSDHRLMLEHAREIWEGCKIIRRILGAKTVRIAIEDNKPDAIRAMAAAMQDADDDVAIVELHTSYPQGSEKQQIFATTGRTVPAGGLPMEVGAVVENVGTTYAIWDAVINGRPLTERITAVTGYGVQTPANLRARIGTSFAEMIAFCGGLHAEACKVIAGGPMMGFAQHSLDVASTKTSSGLLLLTPRQTQQFSSQPCISCGRCLDACPMRLMPAELSQMIEADDIEAAEAINLMDCFECGSCAYVCPAHRPLVQHMRRAKSAVMLKRREEKAKS